jgi:septum formation protein
MPTFERPQLILASGSPRRRALLERFWGSEVQVLTPYFDEAAILSSWLADHGHDQRSNMLALTDTRSLACLLAAGKLQALQSQFQLPEQYAALAADTLVILDDQILGKPVDSADAIRMLKLLSGRTHQVITGICLDVASGGRTITLQATEVTNVRFARLTKEQINWYADTGEPLDKAGAYGIQGFGAALVKQIDGCYYNVMGLPVNRLMVMLQQAADQFSSNTTFAHLLPWN